MAQAVTMREEAVAIEGGRLMAAEVSAATVIDVGAPAAALQQAAEGTIGHHHTLGDLISATIHKRLGDIPPPAEDITLLLVVLAPGNDAQRGNIPFHRTIVTGRLLHHGRVTPRLLRQWSAEVAVLTTLSGIRRAASIRSMSTGLAASATYYIGESWFPIEAACIRRDEDRRSPSRNGKGRDTSPDPTRQT